jgi:hypothetical protein
MVTIKVNVVSEESKVLKEVCKRLESGKIPYMITGSIASNFYSIPRMTRDIDIVIEIHKQDANRMETLFKDDFYIDQDTINEAIQQHGMFNILHNESVIKIDFIIRKNNEYRQLEFQRKKQAEFEDQKIWIVSPEDLILSKLFWAKDSYSEMQLKDIENLLRLVKGLDISYIQKWIKVLGLEEIYKRAQIT